MATFDIMGAYLHAYMQKDKRVLINIRGDFSDIMFQVNSYYKQHVKYEHERGFVSTNAQGDSWLHRALIIVLQVFINNTQGVGFDINPHGQCFENNMIEGIQCTIAW